jgi:hypothetical protein
MKSYLLLLAALFLLSGCAGTSLEQMPTATVTAVAQAIPTLTATTATQEATLTATATVFLPTNTPAATATQEATATATAVSTATPTSAPTPFATEDGLVYLGETLLLDILAEAPGCYVDLQPYVVYSPTKTHFFIMPLCIEGDNQAFVFAADGSDKQRITAPLDLVNMDNISWSADGRTIRYERINSCCLSPEDIPANAPPQGIVEYELDSGTKTVISP